MTDRAIGRRRIAAGEARCAVLRRRSGRAWAALVAATRQD